MMMDAFSFAHSRFARFNLAIVPPLRAGWVTSTLAWVRLRIIHIKASRLNWRNKPLSLKAFTRFRPPTRHPNAPNADDFFYNTLSRTIFVRTRRARDLLFCHDDDKLRFASTISRALRAGLTLAAGTAVGGWVGSGLAVEAPRGMLEGVFFFGMLFLSKRTFATIGKRK